MEAHIFVEGSNTTADNTDIPLREYYKGLFTSINSLYSTLEELTDAHLHILTEDYGVAEAETSAKTLTESLDTPVGNETMIRMGREEIIEAAEHADVMIVLFSTDVFTATIGEIWDEIIDVARPGSIWCLGAARGALDGINTEELESKDCKVITYQRVGVAPIGSETREELIETIKQENSR
jgi:hypothetical protein